MARQDGALPMSCYIVLEVTTRSMLYPLPVSQEGYSNGRRRRKWRCSFTFPRNFQCATGTNPCMPRGSNCGVNRHDVNDSWVISGKWRCM